MSEIVPYQRLIGSLILIATAARPDIAYITNVVARVIHNYGTVHWNAAKTVLKYLKETKDYIIQYDPAELINVVGYSDADFASDLQGRRSKFIVFTCQKYSDLNRLFSQNSIHVACKI